MDGEAPLDNSFPESICEICGRPTNQGIEIPFGSLDEVSKRVVEAKR